MNEIEITKHFENIGLMINQLVNEFEFKQNYLPLQFYKRVDEFWMSYVFVKFENIGVRVSSHEIKNGVYCYRAHDSYSKRFEYQTKNWDISAFNYVVALIKERTALKLENNQTI